MAFPPARTMARVWPVAVALVAALVVLGLLAWTGQPRAKTPWSRSPERLSYCGRSYQRSPTGPAISADEIDRLGIGGGEPLRSVGRIPPFVGRPVLARDAVPAEGWTGAWELCTTGLWLEVGDDEYLYYGLLGGP